MPKIKKDNPRLVATDVYSYIANNSSLTERQVKECFNTYFKLLMSIIESDNRQQDLTIVVPKLGKFYFLQKKGKKNSTYLVPINFGKNDFNREYERVVRDRPSFTQIKFDISDKIKNKLKEKTLNYE